MTAPVSVVVTVLNEVRAIEGLLHDLQAQDAPPEDIVVVDGGSEDGTQDAVRCFPDVRLLCAPGANISQGRNRGIEAARHELVAVTDAGVRLGPAWLRLLTAPLQAGEADVAAGFFVADPHSRFETAMGATVLPSAADVDPDRFLPSSRSLAFRKEVWLRAGGYPEWLDYCEDLVFDINLRRAPQARVAFVPRAAVLFRPRSNVAAFFRQYYRYARGDGKADLWRRRHAVRYLAYLHLALTVACVVSPSARRHTGLVAYFGGTSLAGAVAYLWKPARRLRHLAPSASVADWLCMLALIPVIRLVGDVAKMAGYPAGWRWRLRNRPPDWRR
jgi:glycosyltransferase involved in cell wall biosynthesis